jgi:hypothetical protein
LKITETAELRAQTTDGGCRQTDERTDKDLTEELAYFTAVK